MRRLQQDFITSYIGLVDKATESPRQYNLWCIATIIGAALKRRVWIDRGTFKLFPNTYTVLVGHPGIGKGSAINPAVGLARTAQVVNLFTGKLSIQYIMETLAKGFPVATTGPRINLAADASCLISVPEFEVFLTTSDSLPSLSDLWESDSKDYGTRGRGMYRIEDPCVSLLGGCTPRQVTTYMSTQVVSGGFTRRVNFVFANTITAAIPWPSTNGSLIKVLGDLINDLQHISQLHGEMSFDAEASKLFEGYYTMCRLGTNEFDDEATASYSNTKWAHATKLAMIISVSRDDSLVVTKDDFTLAMSLVEKCGEDLAHIFRAVGESNLASAADRVMRFLEMKQAASFGELVSIMYKHMTKAELEIILATLETGGIVRHLDHGGTMIYMLVPNVKPKMKGVSTIQ